MRKNLYTIINKKCNLHGKTYHMNAFYVIHIITIKSHVAYKKKTILLYQLVGQLSLSQSLRLWAPTQPSYHWKSQVPQWEGRARNHPHFHCKNLQQMGEQAVTVRPTFPTLPTFTTTRPATLNHGRRLHWWKNQSRTLLYLIMVSECLHSFGGFSSHRLPKEPWVGFNLIFSYFSLIFIIANEIDGFKVERGIFDFYENFLIFYYDLKEKKNVFWLRIFFVI